MAINNQDKGRKSGGAPSDDARERLAAGWGQMTANMVSPSGSNGNGSGRGKSRSNGNGAKPLPISALPVPADDEPDAEPAHSLPTNAEGKLSPAQRARLGLDIYGDDAPAQPPAPAPEQPGPATAEPEPQAAAAEQQQAAPTDFNFNGIDPYAQPPASREGGQTSSAAQQGPAAIPQQPTIQTAEQSVEQPRFKPISTEPKLAPVSNEPRLSPVSKPAAARRAGKVQTEEEFKRDNARKRGKPEPKEEQFEAIERDRSVLSYGFAWTAFAIVVTAGIAFSAAIGGDPAAATGPGPMVPGLLSIAMGWVVVIMARGMGRGWGALMLIPALVLFVGPYVYRQYWSTSTEDAARSYLSSTGATAHVDVDSVSVVSETVNTDRGCFGITRTRANDNTEVSVVTYVPTTARQQADFALAPRYAGRIPAGGDRTTGRVFNFNGGRAPAIVQVPREAPLDCANSTSAPGTHADPAAADAQNSQ